LIPVYAVPYTKRTFVLPYNWSAKTVEVPDISSNYVICLKATSLDELDEAKTFARYDSETLYFNLAIANVQVST